jgi:hypothetical protein
MPAGKSGQGLLLALACGLVHAAEKEDAIYASFACQQYALAALKTLGKPRVDATQTASRPDVNDKRWAEMSDVWYAAGAIHAQARFGAATVRSDYRCTIRKVSAGGWKLLELQWPQGHP